MTEEFGSMDAMKKCNHNLTVFIVSHALSKWGWKNEN
jgi:hypothetical protein